MNLPRLQIKHLLEGLDIGVLFGRHEHTVVVHTGHPCLLQLGEGDVLTCGGSEVVGLLLNIGEGVDLVEDHDHRLVAALADLRQRLVDHLNLLLEAGMTDIYYMDQEVGLAHLVESRLEGVYEMGGKLADESHGIGEEEWQILNRNLPHGGVEGGEKFVFGKDVALAQEIHDGGFPDIGISHEGHAGELAPVFTLYALLAIDAFELGLEPGDPVEDDSAVGLDLRFAGTPHAYTAALALEVGPHAGQPREKVLVLRQLHLSAGGSRLRPLGEDVENKARAVQDLYLELPLDVAHLFGREVVVEDYEPYLVVFHIGTYLLELAGAHISARIGIIEFLDKAFLGHGACRAGKKIKLVEILVDLGLGEVSGHETHKHRPLVFLFINDIVFYHINILQRREDLKPPAASKKVFQVTS